jgi:YesN/AraC family two-component response regulator
VIDASEGEQAVKAAKESGGPVHLLLTDIVLPGMKGPDVASKVREIHPDVKVLYTSGYAENVVVRQGLLEKGTAFLEKPFTPDRLARRVRRILDG